MSLRKHYHSSGTPNGISYWLGKIPALDVPPQISVTFKHDCRNDCKCFPIVSTSSLTLDIPAHICNEETMFEVFERALKEDVRRRDLYFTIYRERFVH